MASIPENAVKVDLPYEGPRKFSLKEWYEVTQKMKAEKVDLAEAIELLQLEVEVIK